MEVIASYKQTEVGVIPEDWEVKQLGELFEITSSKRVFQSEWKTEGVPFYRARELAVLGEKGKVKNELFISKEMYDAYNNLYGVPKIGDMLVTGVGTLGKVYIVSDDHEFYFKDGNIIWFKTSGKVRPEFLRQLYLTQLITKQIDDASAGTTVGTYTIFSAKKTTIPAPSLAEQTVIAAVLSDADALISSLDKLISKKRDIKQGAMQVLLTGKKRLPGFNDRWITKKLGQIALISRGASPRPIDSPIWFDEDSYVGWVRISDVTKSTKFLKDTSQKLSELGIRNSHFISKGNLIMSICATIGRPILTDFDVCIHDGFVVFSNPQIIKDFLYYFLSLIEKDWQKHGQTGSQMNLNTGLINSTEIHFPEDTNEQTTIANVLSDMDAEIEGLEHKLTKYKLIKQGMMQELLTGKKRLI